MPKKANFIFEVRIRISEAFTLDSIVRSPRTFKPKDVQSACQNNELVVAHGEPPAEVVSLVTYVMTDFFAMAHATGLYNRQTALWEALSKVTTISVEQLASGVFKKQPLPIYDFSFQDYKGKTLLLANLVSQVPEKKTGLELLKSFISRASGKPVAGVLGFFSAPMPVGVLDYVQHQTRTPDPVARYESVMPGLNKPFDLFELNESDLMAATQDMEGTEMRTVFQLIQPDLRKKIQAGGAPGLPANAKRPKKKKAKPDPDVEDAAEQVSVPEEESVSREG